MSPDLAGKVVFLLVFTGALTYLCRNMLIDFDGDEGHANLLCLMIWVLGLVCGLAIPW